MSFPAACALPAAVSVDGDVALLRKLACVVSVVTLTSMLMVGRCYRHSNDAYKQLVYMRGWFIPVTELN